MVDPSARQASLVAQGNAVAAQAADRVAVIMGASLTGAAQAAVAATKGDSGAGLDEASADMAAARAAMATMATDTEAALAATATLAALVAMVSGWHGEIALANQELPDGLDIVADVAGNQLVDAMRSWPIVGHTAEEWGANLARSWRFQADGLVGNAAATGTDAHLVADFLDLARRTQDNAKTLAVEAFHAGAGAARAAIPAALERLMAGGIHG